MAQPSSSSRRRVDDPTIEAWLVREPEQFNDATLVDLATPGHDSFDVVGTHGCAHVMRDQRAGAGWSLAIAGLDDELAPLLDACAAQISLRGGGTVTWWRAAADAADDALATRCGYRAVRRQHQMRVGLPIDPRTTFPPGVQLRTFRPGDDDAAWLDLNNAVFAEHPEQSSWSAEQLAARCAEPWFDPELFLLAERDGELVGFNWLKCHGADPATGTAACGEIYVIGVHPEAQGSGLGRALVISGLERFAARRVRSAMLYVAADNAAAISLYEALGFRIARTDQAYELVVRPA